MVALPVLVGDALGLLQKPVGRQRSVCSGYAELGQVAGVRGRALSDDQVIEIDSVLNRAATPDAYQVLHVEEVDQFVAIQRDRRDAHAGAHHRDLAAAVGAGEAVHSANLVEAARIIEIGLGDEPGPQWITGEQDRLGDLLAPRIDMRSALAGHRPRTLHRKRPTLTV